MRHLCVRVSTPLPAGHLALLLRRVSCIRLASQLVPSLRQLLLYRRLLSSSAPRCAMFQKVVLVDGRGHLLGRLASILAKELLNGQKVVVVRCEEINISGSLFRNKRQHTATAAAHALPEPPTHTACRVAEKAEWQAKESGVWQAATDDATALFPLASVSIHLRLPATTSSHCPSASCIVSARILRLQPVTVSTSNVPFTHSVLIVPLSSHSCC